MLIRFFKSRSIFLIGFLIGFAFSLLLSLAQDVFFNQGSCKRLWRHKHAARNAHFKLPLSDMILSAKEIVFQNWIKGNAPINKSMNMTYNKWLKQLKFRVKDMDLDKLLYGPDTMEEIKLTKHIEADWLQENVHITCVVFIEKIQLGKSINATWGQHCNSLYFFGQNLDDPDLYVINIDVKLQSSWQLLCEAMNHIWKGNNTLEWIIFVKDDTIVIPENLRYMVAPLNSTQDYYLGHTIVMWGQPYNVAQAGYVLSVAAFEKIVNMFNTSKKCLTGGKYWKKEDYYLAKHLTSLGISPSDTRDQYLRSTFHRYSLPNLLWGAVNPDDNWSPIYQSCCSPLTVTFNAGESDKMYTYNYLLYHLHALNAMGTFGARAAPTPVPEAEVWKIALREEFNITYTSNITSEKYYEIWNTNNSHPENPTQMPYENMPDVLSSILTAYELRNKTTDNPDAE